MTLPDVHQKGDEDQPVSDESSARYSARHTWQCQLPHIHWFLLVRSVAA